MNSSSVSATPTAGLRVAVIGLGRMGVRHVQAAQNLGMDVCGVADIAPAALEAAQHAYGVPAAGCFTDPLTMLAAVKPHALVIATTAPTHAEFVLAAVEQGVRHILCEKPMTTSLAQAEAMEQACRQAGVQLAVNHQMRFMSQYSRVKALIGTEAFGPLSSIVIAGSNFGLAMNASHYFEMFRYMTDGPVAQVQAWFENELLPNPRGKQFEDRSGRLLAMGAAGQSMYIDFSAHAGHGQQLTYICRYGQISMDALSSTMRLTSRQAEHRELPTTRYGMPADIETIQLEPADTVAPTMEVWRAMLGGQSFPDAAVGSHAMACLVAAHASHDAGGRAVALTDASLPRDQIFPWA